MNQQTSLQDKIAQLFTFSAFGPKLDEHTLKLVKELKPGGIFLGTECLDHPEQVYQLTRALQESALADSNGIPLFISADFVAGAGCKLKRGVVHFPKNRAIGAGGDEALAYESGRITALESLAMGVNFNYSPVADINNNPENPVIGTHSFGEDRDLVSRLACAVIRGYQEQGLIATAKHFPGHGDTHVDSHEDLPVLPFDRHRLESFEMVPFQKAIEAGVDAVMVGHMAVPELDPSMTPASLSYRMITGILRDQMGFQGLVVTDGLSMKGITNRYSLEEACVKAIQAGADILLATADSFEQAASMMEAVRQAVEEGTISSERIEQAYRRIMKVKEKYGLLPHTFQVKPFHPAVYQTILSGEVDMQLAEQAATPLHGLKKGALASDAQEKTWVLVRGGNTERFAVDMKSNFPIADEKTAPGYEGVLALVKKTPDSSNLILALSHNKPMKREWLQKLREAVRSKASVVWVHFGSEYDVSDQEIPTLLMYDHAPSLQQAAVAFLMSPLS